MCSCASNVASFIFSAFRSRSRRATASSSRRTASSNLEGESNCLSLRAREAGCSPGKQAGVLGRKIASSTVARAPVG